RRLLSQMCVFTISPQSFFYLEVLGHEFGDDFVLLADFGFELFALLGLGRWLRTTWSIEDEGRILEEIGLPTVEPAGLNFVFIAHCGDRLPIDEVPLRILTFSVALKRRRVVFLLGFVMFGLGYERPNYSSKLNRQNSHFI
ncbi:MAG: hypothetical protein ACI8T1_005219, partial [Verrucomicrobiales bacterium]